MPTARGVKEGLATMGLNPKSAIADRGGWRFLVWLAVGWMLGGNGQSAVIVHRGRRMLTHSRSTVHFVSLYARPLPPGDHVLHCKLLERQGNEPGRGTM